MEREIKFRGKRIGGGDWLFGSHYNDGGEDYILPNSLASAWDYEDYQVDPNTIGQFVGLTDRNGKQIYEGDILMQFSIPCEVQWCERMASFSLGVFAIEKCTLEKLEVVGNIYDNPELLKKKQ